MVTWALILLTRLIIQGAYLIIIKRLLSVAFVIAASCSITLLTHDEYTWPLVKRGRWRFVNMKQFSVCAVFLTMHYFGVFIKGHFMAESLSCCVTLSAATELLF